MPTIATTDGSEVEEPRAWVSLLKSKVLPENHGFLFVGRFQAFDVCPGNGGRSSKGTLALTVPG
jgi:hypothetical protein